MIKKTAIHSSNLDDLDDLNVFLSRDCSWPVISYSSPAVRDGECKDILKNIVKKADMKERHEEEKRA
ncbi:hypothetical protein VU04_00950 [Desulfobulbus sp. TB]|nr:hypothetical protein [Desulfobulbus sp. TB]